MLSKKYFASVAAALLVLFGGTAVFAQTAQVRGRVQVKKADGTTEPVAGARIDVYRTDAKGKPPSAKTNKKGEFAFAGLNLGQTFVLVASGEKIAPGMQPNVKAGMEDIVITVNEGDGKVLTEAEVRAALSGEAPANNTSAANNPTAANNTTANTTTANPAATPDPQAQAAASKMTPEELKKAQEDQKKAQAEYEKEKAKVEAGNKKITESNELSKKAFEEGNAAINGKNYDLAITKYDEAVAAQPDLIGATTVFLNNKSIALVNRATDNYNKAVKSGTEAKTAALPGIKKDYEDAVTATNRSLEIYNASTDAAAKEKYKDQKMVALSQRKEAFRLMVKTGADRTRGKEAVTAFEEYLAVETDAAKKSTTQLAYAEALQDTNEFEAAAAEFEKVLANDPNNVDALAGAGLSLVNVGYVNNDKTKFQQAANYLQKFDDLAPANHRYKGDAKGIIETLKNEQKVTPQKVTTTKKKS